MVDPNALPVPPLGYRCHSCDYDLTGAGEHRCPECGRPFSPDDYLPPGAYPLLIVEGSPVRPTADVIALLDEHQVPHGSELNPLDQAFGFRFSAVEQPTVTIMRDFYWDAVDLIVRERRGLPLPDAPPPREDRPDWVCDGCQESNPGTFDVCWQCGRERLGDGD